MYQLSPSSKQHVITHTFTNAFINLSFANGRKPIFLKINLHILILDTIYYRFHDIYSGYALFKKSSKLVCKIIFLWRNNRQIIRKDLTKCLSSFYLIFIPVWISHWSVFKFILRCLSGVYLVFPNQFCWSFYRNVSLF